MRIALVAGEDPGWGGIGTYCGILADALAAAGHETHLVLRGWEAEAPQRCDGVTVHRVLVREPGWRRGTVTAVERLYGTRECVVFAAGVARRLAAIAPDIVEAPEFGAPGLLAALRARAGRAAPVVVRLHGPTFLTTGLAGVAADLDTRVIGLLEGAATRAGAAVSAPSRAMAALVAERWRLPGRRVAVSPNPIDAERFTPAAEAIPEDGSAAPEPTVLVVGRLERAKGQDRLVAALPEILAAVPDARVRMIGEDGGLATLVVARAKALGVHDRVELTGAVARAHLPEAYRAAAVCVVPSRFEAFGYTCVEAMACGRPVVASRTGGLAEIVEDGETGRLIDPDRPGALARAVIELLRDATARARMGAAARIRVVNTYAAPAVARHAVREYGKLVA